MVAGNHASATAAGSLPCHGGKASVSLTADDIFSTLSVPQGRQGLCGFLSPPRGGKLSCRIQSLLSGIRDAAESVPTMATTEPRASSGPSPLCLPRHSLFPSWSPQVQRHTAARSTWDQRFAWLGPGRTMKQSQEAQQLLSRPLSTLPQG